MKQVYDEVEAMVREVEGAVHTTEEAIRPLRDSVFRRFPVLFTLLTTFGVGATFFGIERIITDIPWLNTHPWVIFWSGIALLVLTGTLYKKL